MTAEKLQALLRIESQLREHDFPPQIVCETTAFCNFRCVHCHHEALERPKGHMSDALWSRIVTEVAREKPDAEFWPTFYGEALMLRDRLFARIRQARDLGLTNLVLNSNGSYCRDGHNHDILTCGLRKFILSLDGLTKETFEHVRFTRDPHGKFEPVYAGVRDLLELKRQLDDQGERTPTIICQFSKMERNEHEAEAFAEYWLGLGAEVKIREKLTWTGYVAAENLTRKYTQRIACPWGNNTCAIHWNGDVVACAVDNEGRFVGGNVNQQSIREIWTTSMRAFRKAHRDHRWDDLPELCRQCIDWQAVGATYYKPSGEVYQSVAATE
ncbi:MAG: radical SAM protein [Planctomycetes bacterium]|nr:radical SAM protein [Planctomycetota bacterium]